MTTKQYGCMGVVLTALFMFACINGVWLSAARAAENGQIDIRGSEFRMQPDSVTVQAGQPVVIVFHNDGVLSHNLVIDALGLKTKTIHTGATTRLSFTPQKSGRYVFRCSVPGHTEAGMRGVLVVR